MPKKKTEQVAEAVQSPFKTDEDFASLYANNVIFEKSVWDLKMIFGQLDQSQQQFVVEQHTAITVSWSHAKLMAYLLAVNVALHEIDNGLVTIPPSVIPSVPDPTAPEVAGNKRAVLVMEYLRSLHKRYFGES